MSLLTLIVQALRAKVGRQRPVEFSHVIKAKVKQVSRWSLPLYLCVAAAFVHITQLFRGVARMPEFASLQMGSVENESPNICLQGADQLWARLCHTPSTDPFPPHNHQPRPGCTLTHIAAVDEHVDKVFVWSDGFALTCSQKAKAEFSQQADSLLRRLKTAPPPQKLTLIHAGLSL